MMPDSEHQNESKAGCCLLEANWVVGKETDVVQTTWLMTGAKEQSLRTCPLPVCEVLGKVAYYPSYPFLESLYYPPKPSSQIIPSTCQEYCFSGGV